MPLPKKALLVGANYTSIPQVRLNGCIDDVINMRQVLQDSFDYDIANITLLRDDVNTPGTLPTRANILTQLQNLVNQSANLSELWFHYSGHGSQIKDTGVLDEADGLDEVIVPIDFQTNGFILDDDIFNIIKNSKCKTMLIFDSCHSASICDLQWGFSYDNNIISKNVITNKIITNPNVFCFSACKDNQTAADAYNGDTKEFVGAFTDTFISCLRMNHMNVDIFKLYLDVCTSLKNIGFTQIPALSCSSQTPSYTFTRSTNYPLSTTNTPIVNGPSVVPVVVSSTSTVAKKDLGVTYVNNYILKPNVKRQIGSMGKMTYYSTIEEAKVSNYM
jgi:hypothetical protein